MSEEKTTPEKALHPSQIVETVIPGPAGDDCVLHVRALKAWEKYSFELKKQRSLRPGFNEDDLTMLLIDHSANVIELLVIGGIEIKKADVREWLMAIDSVEFLNSIFDTTYAVNALFPSEKKTEESDGLAEEAGNS